MGQSNTGCYTYSVRLLQGDIVLHNSMYWGLGVVRGWAFYSTCIYFVRGWDTTCIENCTLRKAASLYHPCGPEIFCAEFIWSLKYFAKLDVCWSVLVLGIWYGIGSSAMEATQKMVPVDDHQMVVTVMSAPQCNVTDVHKF